jgi:hypothetical protein
MTTGAEIIADLKKNFPQQEDHLTIRNCAFGAAGINNKTVVQYIVGVTGADPITGTHERYNAKITGALNGIAAALNFPAWSFTGYEVDAMKAALHELSQEYNIEMDVDNMVDRLNMPRNEQAMFYLVVSVVQYNIAYIA